MVVLREDTILQLGNVDESKKTLDFFKEVFPKLNILYINSLAKLESSNKNGGDEKMDCDNTTIESEGENEEVQSALRLFKVGEYEANDAPVFFDTCLWSLFFLINIGNLTIK